MRLQINQSIMLTVYTLCPKKILNIFICNFKKDYQILIRNIPETTGHQMTIHFPTSPNVCFCTTCEKQNQQNITLLSNAV